MSDSRADDARYAAERVMDPILRRWFAIDLDPVDAERNAENAAVDLSWHLENVGLLNRPTLIDEEGVEHICDALIEVGPWDEIDGDGTEASIIADHIRDLPRLLAPPPGEPDEGATGHIAAMERVAVDALRSKRDGYRSVIQEIADTSEDAATVRFARRALGFDEGER